MSNLRPVIAALLIIGVITMACPQQPQPREDARDLIQLPEPQLDGEMSVEAAIEARRSVRQFADEALTLQEIGQLAWAAQGITDEGRGLRATPSAGATYPLQILLVTAESVSLYRPEAHALEPHITGDRRDALAQAALGQDSVRTAPLVIAVTALYERTAGLYGPRAERYVHMEVGHLGQNVHLQAVALGLGSVPIGAFDDGQVAECLGVVGGYVPLYLIPVGHPR